MDWKCIIWKTPLSLIKDNEISMGAFIRSKDDNLYQIWNPRAGGKYTVSYKSFLYFRSQQTNSLENKEKIRLSAYIAKENLKNNTPFLNLLMKDDDWLEKLPPIPNLSKRAYLLLEGLVKLTDFIGKTFNYSALINSLDENNSPDSFFYALSYCDKQPEMNYLLKYLEKMQLIDIGKDHHGSIINFQVSVKGFEKINISSNINSKIAFVAMWIHSKTDAVHKRIENAIRKAGYDPLRVDKKEHINKIDDQVLVEINKAKFMICDLTSEKDKPRGSVYFEAGYALGKNIPIIWTCSKDQIEGLPFDIRQYNCLSWESDKWQEFEENLKNRVENVIGKGSL